MARAIRFHLDENCDPRIAVGLRALGVDVTTTAEAGLLQAPDDQHFSFAIAHNRAIVTQDADFLRIAAAGTEHPGIAFYPPGSRTIGQVIRGVQLIWEVLEPAEMRNRVEFL
jgi:predicted nuclease of predicted toxin-antitoxin system